MTVALHGNLGTVDDWELDGELNFTPVDLWQEVKGSCGLEESAADLCAAVSAHEKQMLLGYSLGGRLALHALLHSVELWSAAVIVSAHPGLSDEAERAARLEKDRAWAERALHDDWDEFLAAWNAQPVFTQPPTGEVMRSQRRLQSSREEVARGFEVWSLGRQRDLVSDLQTCPVPVLWVSGENDAKFSEIASRVADVMPQGEHLALANCGHRVLAEAPDRLAAAIRDFQTRNM